jgi:hypothetical protein
VFSNGLSIFSASFSVRQLCAALDTKGNSCAVVTRVQFSRFQRLVSNEATRSRAVHRGGLWNVKVNECCQNKEQAACDILCCLLNILSGGLPGNELQILRF